MSSHVDTLAEAIKNHRIVRIAYSRKGDDVLSLHYVAPVDIRPGETSRTADTMYLWAYCFDESRVEMHLLGRVRSVLATGDHFDPADILVRWPTERWPLPAEWVVERDW